MGAATGGVVDEGVGVLWGAGVGSTVPSNTIISVCSEIDTSWWEQTERWRHYVDSALSIDEGSERFGNWAIPREISGLWGLVA